MNRWDFAVVGGPKATRGWRRTDGLLFLPRKDGVAIHTFSFDVAPSSEEVARLNDPLDWTWNYRNERGHQEGVDPRLLERAWVNRDAWLESGAKR